MNHTSIESAKLTINLAAKLRARIIALARAAGPNGITISEASSLISDHKNTSVSPRFSELVARNRLVRVLKPGGVTRYATRFDLQTKRNVIIHWLPEFAPTTPTATVKAMRNGPRSAVRRSPRKAK